MADFLIRLLPDYLQDKPYLNRKFVYQFAACTTYFLFSGYGLVKHNNILFWLNIPEIAKYGIIALSIVFLFMGFMGFFVLMGIIVNLPFQIIKEVYKTYFDK